MKNGLMRLNVAALIIALLGVYGCDKQAQVTEVEQVPVHIHNGQECDLCGMIISQFPGPKGQLFTRGNDQPLAFCSTRDLFAYALQPEHKHRVQGVFVQDVATADWEAMASAEYINAKSAFYVIGHSQLGAMGPTLAAFAERTAAEHFAHQYGGEVKAYQDIDQALLNSMNHMAMGHTDTTHSNMEQPGMNSHMGAPHMSEAHMDDSSMERHHGMSHQ